MLVQRRRKVPDRNSSNLLILSNEAELENTLDRHCQTVLRIHSILAEI